MPACCLNKLAGRRSRPLTTTSPCRAFPLPVTPRTPGKGILNEDVNFQRTFKEAGKATRNTDHVPRSPRGAAVGAFREKTTERNRPGPLRGAGTPLPGVKRERQIGSLLYVRDPFTQASDTVGTRTGTRTFICFLLTGRAGNQIAGDQSDAEHDDGTRRRQSQDSPHALSPQAPTPTWGRNGGGPSPAAGLALQDQSTASEDGPPARRGPDL